ncbi:MAG: ABC transporter ATP-binding protein [Acidimicrobiia bacterium]|nr:ABC transporter ATP-binding protein [Acidimicrobiia bacterium]
MTAVLVCRDVGVRFGEISALTALDLTVGAGELVAVLGPSGSGKTTLLHAIAGFVDLDDGSIGIAGRLVADASTSVVPEERSVGVVFQQHALWPHLTALQTVAFPLRQARMAGPERSAEAHRLLGRLGIAHLADRRPAELSGGEQQRVSLARALARHPALFLFDEPTAHLDGPLRRTLLDEIDVQRRQDAATTLYATHDATEALAIADRVVLLRNGSIVQVGSPIDVYERPVDRWAADLTGRASMLDLEMTAGSGSRARISIGGAERDVDCSGAGRGFPLVRPEWAGLGGPFDGVLDRVWYRGSRTEYRLNTAAGPLVLSEAGGPRAAVGDEVGWDIRRVHLLTAAG